MVKTVLITGATGYSGIYAIVQFIKDGYKIHTTVRDLKSVDATKEIIKDAGKLTDEQVNEIKFFQADLNNYEIGFDKAIENCDYVVHIAYPFINGVPLEQLYKPGVDGSMHLLKLCIESPTVKHFCLCSSIATVMLDPNSSKDKVFTENDYSPIDSPIADGYMQSKCIVEQKMVDLINSDENLKSKYPITFNAALPYGIMGPIPKGLNKWSGLLFVYKSLISNEHPLAFDSHYNVTDVRDLAKAFVTLVENPKTYGERFIIINSHEIGCEEFIDYLKKVLPKQIVDNYPTEWVSFDPPGFGRRRNISTEKAEKTFGYKPIPYDVTLTDTIKGIADYLEIKH